MLNTARTLAVFTIAIAAMVASAASLAAQPNMEAALASLQAAKESLQKATADKGGHRAKAMKLVDQAMAEVNAGIEWDRTHLSPAEKAKK